jgi:(1->4)-alpha-D-glucan 1-alpha-D-glucosylmutase
MASDADVDDLLRRAMEFAAANARPPVATYRLQFHAKFTFRDATAIVPYLHDLGISHVYASPYLKATPGSTHGYDVIDHCSLNPELGTREDFDAFLDALARHGMSHVLDIVPNHVGVATNDNAWWNDVLARGPASPYAKFFDIAWRGSPRPELHDKVLLPVLGGHYADVLERGELRFAVLGERAGVHYYDRRFPLSAESLARRGGPTEALSRSLNGTPGDPASFDALDALLNEQHYRLAYWRVASDEINYRRFFDINDLAALSMERPEVFDATHPLILGLLAEGQVGGLRIDHPDGLYDPAAYFERPQREYLLAVAHRLHGNDDWENVRDELRARLESQPAPTSAKSDASSAKPLYVVAEKILAPDEPLPRTWPVHGTSGYDYLIKVNNLFVDPAAEDEFTRLYADFTGDARPFDEHVYENKRLILERSLASELQMLAHRLDRLARRHRRSRDFTHRALREALRETIACFGVYRTYVTGHDGVSERDAADVEAAVRAAVARNPQAESAVFEFLRDTLLLRTPGFDAEDARAERLAFVGKFQQLSAPATAKGVEDTAFYRYNRLASLNEVGGDPGRFGLAPEALHAYLVDRQANWPHAMSCLSTHDTKRSEDVRARLNVLTEVPEEWAARVRRWAELNEPLKRPVANAPAPDRNDEYLLYQTLIGAWPVDDAEAAGDVFRDRVRAYMKKATREAKVHTSWTDPNEAYEQATSDFVAALLDRETSAEFLDDFLPFQRRVAQAGLINSLAQTVLRIATPGVPDTYQGTELWDLSLVDPDNRRPVDYARRREMLAALRERATRAGADLRGFASELLGSMTDGRIKLYVTWRALTARRDHHGLFARGEYFPISLTGPAARHAFAFARVLGDECALVAVPRFVDSLGRAAWRQTRLAMPDGVRGRRLRNVFTGESVEPAAEIELSVLTDHFPLALLVSE